LYRYKQAMMELGATVCTPRAPDCAGCPISAGCAARALAESEAAALGLAGDAADGLSDQPFLVTDLPEKEKKAKAREETVAVRVVEAVVRGGGGDGDSSAEVEAAASSFLLVRRPEGGLLAGLWEFPSVVMPAGEAGEADDGGEADAAGQTAAAAGARAAAVQALVDSLGVPGVNWMQAQASAAKSVGKVVHVFSHIRQTMAGRCKFNAVDPLA
jgi:A/G-specific adenine glycosylase